MIRTVIYADYDYYVNAFGGGCSEQEFTRCAAEASAFIDRVTFGRAAGHAGDERLKLCCCSLVEIARETDGTGGYLKQSESVGAWSYTLSSAASNATVSTLMKDKCAALLPSEWLYRGVARE